MRGESGRSEQEKAQARAAFSAGLGMILPKYGLTWDDVDVDYKNMMISFKVDLTQREKICLISSIERLTGGQLK